MEIRKYTVYDEKQILALYESVGWTAYTADPAALRKGFEGSLLVLAAWEEQEVLGLVRAVGDGHTIVFIQDLLVQPRWQRKGVGSALVQAVVESYPHVRQIELAADAQPQTIAFYKKMGFAEMSEVGCCAFMKIQA